MINAINNGNICAPKYVCIIIIIINIVVAVVVGIWLFCLIEIMKWLNALNSDDKMAKLQLFGVIVCDDGGKSGWRSAHMCKWATS